MRPKRASAGMLRESPSSQACSTNSQRRRSSSAAVCGLAYPALEQKLKKVAVEARHFGKVPRCNQTVTQKSSGRSQSFPAPFHGRLVDES